MIKIGITGSISSGKTTVSKYIAKNKYPIFNADKEVKKIYKSKSFKNKIYKRFNIKNKKQIEILLIKKPSKLKVLEKIIHPIVRKSFKKFTLKNKKNKYLIYEIPLLVENKMMKHFHQVIFINSKKNLRKKRYLKSGKSIKIFNILDQRQFKAKKKVKFCDFVINNNNSLKQLKKNAKLILNNL